MPLEDELKHRITRLELDLQETQRKLIVRDTDISAKKKALAQQTSQIRELDSQNKKIKTEVNILHREIATLTSDKEQLVQEVKELKQVRVKPTPSHLVNSFRLAMDDLQESLKPGINDRIGYAVSQFDVDLKTTIMVDKKDGLVRLVLPEPGESIPVENLSSVKFTFSSVPIAEPPDDSLVEVPFLLGLSEKTAQRELLSSDLKLGKRSRQASDYPPGTVIGQYPNGGDLVPHESSIDLVFAKSLHVTVPLLTGKLQFEAEEILKEIGLVLGTVEKQENDAPFGTILSQEPEAETLLPEGDKIDIVVATPIMTSVPDIKGHSLDEALELLAKGKLKAGRVKKIESDREEGIVLEQNPDAGDIVPVDTEVSIVVSTIPGKVKVPSVIEKSLGQAKEILGRAKLKVGVVTSKLHPTQNGVVLRQSPKKGVKVAKGSAVNLIIAKKRRIRDVFEAIKKHPDIRKTGFTFKTLAGRFEKAGIDSVKKLKKFAELPNIKVSSELKLRNQVKAPGAVKDIIKEVLEEKQ